MKISIPSGMMLALLVCLVVSTAVAGSGGTATLSGGDYELSGRLSADVGALSVSDETWRLGFPWEGDMSGAFVTGQSASEAATFRSAEAADSYYILPASASTATLRSARFCILRRTGAYSGEAEMSLEVVGADGGVRHTASRSNMNVASAQTGVWTSIPLALTTDDLKIAPGERLAFHCEMSAGVSGDLDVRTIFETQVGSGTIEHPVFQYLPILVREY